MQRRIIILIILILLASLSACGQAESEDPGGYVAEETSDDPGDDTGGGTYRGSGPNFMGPHVIAKTDADLLQPADFTYLGAFRLPMEPGGTSNWDYSGQALAFYPDGDPGGGADGYPGSLFGAGHDHQLHVSEFSIPAPVNSRNIEDLPTAITLQPFADITGGMITEEMDLPRFGLEYLPADGRLHFLIGQWYQDFDPSHGWASLDLENPNPAGPWTIPDYTNYVTSEYLFALPGDWAAANTDGRTLATGRFREGVWAGGGPALFAIAPWEAGNPPGVGAALDVTPILLYGTQNPGAIDIVSDENQWMTGYLEADHWSDGAWLNAGEKSAVAFIGTKAMISSWYGFADGTVWDYECAYTEPPTCPDVPEWPYDNRGYWAEAYQAELLFFDPDDLAAVANGTSETWSPQPYAVLSLNETFFDANINLGEYKIDLAGAMAFDAENGLLYLIERLADEYRSVIHVWRVG